MSDRLKIVDKKLAFFSANSFEDREPSEEKQRRELLDQLTNSGVTVETTIHDQPLQIRFVINGHGSIRHDMHIFANNTKIGHISFDMNETKKELYIHSKKIKEEYQGKGIMAAGSSLVAEFAKQHQITKMSGLMHISNRRSIKSREGIVDLFTGISYDVSFHSEPYNSIIVTTHLTPRNPLLRIIDHLRRKKLGL
ncbi:MAG TPA: GNAT family N-acetyltransferase [Vitreimonas sp.]|nr:GNAT family N-acetyltransferase [Vitreimonas sp.]